MKFVNKFLIWKLFEKDSRIWALMLFYYQFQIFCDLKIFLLLLFQKYNKTTL